MIHPRQWMSFYSYIFKPGDFIKGYCFNISWMDECTHWWNTGKNEAHTAWNDHSLSFPNMFSNSVFYMQSKKQLGVFWAFWHNVFYSSTSEETELRMHAFKWQENGCWDFQLGGGGWDVTVSECAEKVGDETKMCLSMPTGVLTLLQASIAFCQERKLKGHPF